ncbi:MAG: flagellar hook-associated protein FlgK [Lachnospiraceae bacterium]
MPSQFFGLTIAGSGLNTAQAALHTTANNISNVHTEGYSKQQAMTQAAEAIRVTAKYGTMGAGVQTTAIKQLRDEFYDKKYWENSCKEGLYERRLYYTKQIDSLFQDDDAITGFSSLLNKTFNAITTLQGKPDDTDVRTTVVSSSQDLCNYFNSMSQTLTDLQVSCNQEIDNLVTNINSIAQKISILNKQINVVELTGGYANELRDQRALLIDELSAIVPTTAVETQVVNSQNPDDPTGATNFQVKINGQVLVDTFEYRTLQCVSRKEKVNQSDVDGLYDITWSDTGNKFNVTANSCIGSLKALFDVRDGNNNENFRGVVSKATSTYIDISNPSQSTIDQMTMSERGLLTVDNTKYAYDGFDVKTDENGNISTYRFYLKNPITQSEASGMVAKDASLGEGISFMGIPYYMAQMNSFVRSYCKEFNDIQKQQTYDAQGHPINIMDDSYGVDGYGNKAGNFFDAKDVTGLRESYEFTEYTKKSTDNLADTADDTTFANKDTYYKLTASNLQVRKELLKDANLMATETREEYINGVADHSTVVNELLTLKSDRTIFRGNSADGFLKCMISDVSVSTQESEIFYNNYNNISNTITNQRMSVSGVDEDEEALDLIKFQNAYNLASRMIQTLTEIYDRLILQTGV